MADHDDELEPAAPPREDANIEAAPSSAAPFQAAGPGSAPGSTPLAYIVGRQTFMGIELIAAPGALVPREETELLGATAVKTLRALADERGPGEELRVIDMCCGSGNLACGIAVAVPAAMVWASDLTDGCVTLARRNVRKLGIDHRAKVLQGDLFGALAGLALEGTLDVIVCNPPYISTARLNERTDLAHEPREAFDGGPYGLTIHQRVVREALPFLRPGGWLLFEFGLGQDRQLKMVFERARAYEAIELVRNDAGEPRVAIGRKRKES
jgi:release factor glutamine methyltransferase